MARTKTALRMADRLTGGTLAEKIAGYRKARAPWAGIADQLRKDFGVEVTPETLKSWATDLGVDDDGEMLPEAVA